jgi:type IX secretion system PorP/SprF family membrane protein
MKKLLSVLLLFASLNGAAQDLHYSHFMQAPLQRGASEAGNFNGDLRLTALQRRQWSSVTTPYRSLSFAADGKLSALHSGLKGLNAGVQINYDRAGDGDLTALQVLLSVSYNLAITSDSTHFIRVGMQGGMVQRSIDFNALTFDNQYNGDVFNPQALSGENFGENKFSTGDWGLGIGWTGIGESGMLDAGLQVMHLNRAQWSLLESGDAKYPLLYQFTLAAEGASTEPLQWKPALTIMRQDENTEITGGTELQFRLKNKPVRAWAFSVAAFYRYRDAFIPQVALYYDKFRFGFSYDINVSGLREVSNARGGAEFSIIYIARKIRSQSKSSTVCPVY